MTNQNNAIKREEARNNALISFMNNNSNTTAAAIRHAMGSERGHTNRCIAINNIMESHRRAVEDYLNGVYNQVRAEHGLDPVPMDHWVCLGR